jgi:hypothetical protein
MAGVPEDAPTGAGVEIGTAAAVAEGDGCFTVTAGEAIGLAEGATASVIDRAICADRVTGPSGARGSPAAHALNIDRLINQTASAQRFMRNEKAGSLTRPRRLLEGDAKRTVEYF